MTHAAPETKTLAWSFHDTMRSALLARLGERMLLTRWEITPLGREAIAAHEARDA